MSKLKKIRVKYSKLGREKVWGYAHMGDGMVELDERLRGKKHLEILLHESVHLLFPEMDEDGVIDVSVVLTKLLWSEGYRRVDGSDKDFLQDGGK
jgi:hypothetical protein